MKKRVVLVVLDSAGIGALPDASVFGDEGSNTIGNIYIKRGKLDLPNMCALGLGNIDGSVLPPCDDIIGSYGKAAEITKAKDTTCGHWEMCGITLDKPFKTFPNGFPQELITRFEKAIGRGVLGNYVASGTQIIKQLGDEHVRTGKPIVYTSADSVFQIAAHEDVIPLEELYDMCRKARAMLVGEYNVGRVIARPFNGTSGNYTRTGNRRDFSVDPPEDTILDGLVKAGKNVIGVGKIEDIFDNHGLTESNHTKNNHDSFDAALNYVKSGKGELIFANLVDFDMLYGHRNDVEGYAEALETFDKRLPELMSALADGDMLIITADHGCDPTTPGTDHSREFVPILVYGRLIKRGINIGVRDSFADIGATVYEYITDRDWTSGKSFLDRIIREDTVNE